MTFPMNDAMATSESLSIAMAINRKWSEEVVAVPARRGAELQYWRMCDKPGCPKHTDRFTGENSSFGWITVGPSMGSPIEHARYINSKHMTPLPQYGTMPYGEMGAANPWLRFDQLLRRGGINEFPVTQIRAYNWDKIPEILNARPDAAIDRIPCELGCVGREFLSVADYKQHIEARHGEQKGTMAMGEAVKGIVQAQHQTAADPVAIGAAVATAIAQMMPEILRTISQPTPPQEVPVRRGRTAVAQEVEEYRLPD